MDACLRGQASVQMGPPCSWMLDQWGDPEALLPCRRSLNSRHIWTDFRLTWSSSKHEMIQCRGALKYSVSVGVFQIIPTNQRLQLWPRWSSLDEDRFNVRGPVQVQTREDDVLILNPAKALFYFIFGGGNSRFIWSLKQFDMWSVIQSGCDSFTQAWRSESDM